MICPQISQTPKFFVFCSEAAERFSFAVLSTAKEKMIISAQSAPRAKRAVSKSKEYII